MEDLYCKIEIYNKSSMYDYIQIKGIILYLQYDTYFAPFDLERKNGIKMVENNMCS